MSGEANKGDQSRKARLSEALRENLKRRKSQAKGRADKPVVTPEDDAARENEQDSRDG